GLLRLRRASEPEREGLGGDYASLNEGFAEPAGTGRDACSHIARLCSAPRGAVKEWGPRAIRRHRPRVFSLFDAGPDAPCGWREQNRTKVQLTYAAEGPKYIVLSRLMPPITVVIADQRRARRSACRRLLQPQRGIRVVAEGRSGLDALAASRLKPRILLFGL